MKLIYSFIDSGTIKKALFFLLFVVPVYTFSQNCTVNANADRSLCPGGQVGLPPDQFYLFGAENSDVAYLSNPVWTQISGPSVNITNPNELQALITGGVPGNTYGFRLTATCGDGSTVSDDVKITILPITFANAGPDKTYCQGTYPLSGNAPGAKEVGTWTISGGNSAGITINSPNSPTSTITVSGTSSGSTTLVWTIDSPTSGGGSGCKSTDEVVISTLGGVQPVNAGVDITLSKCYSATQNVDLNGSFGGTTPGQQQGTWTVVSGPNVPSFSNVNDNKTNVSGLVQGTYVFQWTVAGTCANGTDQVTVIVPPPTADVTNVSGGSSYYCDGRTSVVLQGTVPLYVNETVQWTQTGGPTAAIANPTSPTTLVTGMTTLGTYTFLYTLTNATTACVRTGTYTVVLEDLISISGGPDQALGCDVDTATIPVTSTGSGQMKWQIVSGPNVNPLLNPPYPSYPTALTNFSGNSLTVTQLVFSGTYVVRIIKNPNPGSACETVYDDVKIVASEPAEGSNAGTMQVLACNATSAVLQGNTTDQSGKWSQVSGPTAAVFADIHNPKTVVSSLVNGQYQFRWTISGGTACAVTQSIAKVVVSNATPTPANAGSDQSICYGTPVQLQGNPTVATETGLWTVSPNAGITFNDATKPNAIAKGLVANTVYTFTWTISNGCGTSSDTVFVTTNSSQGGDADAGPDQCLPTGTSSITLAGSDPAPGTGVWTQTAGAAATITNPTQFNTTVTGLVDDDYAFKWTVTNSGCSIAEDTVAVTIAPDITVADAGPDQNICGVTATLTGNTPAAGETGLWEFVSGGDGPVITNPTSPTTTITGLTDGAWVYKWTISRGACPSSSDSVQLNMASPPSQAVAGPDQTICNQTSTTLAATAPTVGSGIWSLVSGPNSPVFSDARSASSTISNLITGDYILEWTTYSGIICPESKDQVNIKITEAAAAGPDQSTCLEGPLYLTGNDGSTGTWSYVSGPNTPVITATGSNSASVTGLIPGVYVFRYTIAAQGLCLATSDDVQVTINGQITTPPNAGPDQTLCDVGILGIQLSASALDAGTTGLWTVLTGPPGGSFVNANDPNTRFTGAGYGIYVFNWTVSAGTCSSSDQVRIENAQPPSPAVAEGDNAICGSTTELTATPPTVGTGKWTLVNGPTPVTFSSEILPTTTVSGLTQTGGLYIFSWTVTNGTVCNANTDEVNITVTADLTTPDAGPDQTICQSDSAVLAANTITVGTGAWSKFSGPIGGSFSDTASPTSTFTPNAVSGAGTYVLRWTSTNLSCIFTDDMTLTVDPLPSTSNAGTPISVCQFQPVTLNANAPTTGTGLWTQVLGTTTATFTDPTSPTTAVLGTEAGSYTFRWTISNGSCASSFSDVVVTINALPPLADAGLDQTICNTSTATLNGNDPAAATGLWEFVLNAGNTAVITNPNAFNTTVTNISQGTTRLKWTISNGSCTAYSDEVQITKPSDLTTSPLTTDSTICQGGTITLSTTPSGSLTPYSYQWQSSPNGLTGWTDISGQTSASYTTDSALTSGEYYYRVNVSNSCTQVTSTVGKLTIIPDPIVTTQPIGNTICSGNTHTMTVAGTTTNTAAGTISYQWQSSTDGTSGWTNVSGGTGATTDTYTTAALTSNLYFRARIFQSGSGCETFSDPALVNVVTITAQPATPAPVCVGGIVNINITASLNGGTGTLSYQWQSDSGSGFVNETNASATTPDFTSDPLTGTTQFRCLVTSSTTNCVLTSNVVTATIVIDPSITAQPSPAIVCNGGSNTLSVTATGGTPGLNYQWYSSPDNVSFTLIAGANSATYTTPALTANTYYRVDVSATGNGCGLVTSNSALITVIPDPVITTQPVGSTICSGNTHTMTVVASGDLSGGALIYQWERSTNGTSGWANTTGGSGATTATYTTGALTSNFYYRVHITQASSGCEVYSNVASVFVARITAQPAAPVAICVGGTVNINITASLSGGAGTLSYQWQGNSGSGFVNETNASATTPNFTSDPLAVTTQFRCLVTSSTTNCTLTSNAVTATVVPDPTITAQPTGTTICSGGNATVSVTASNGTPSLTYQWSNSTDNITFTPIGGATASTYATPNLTQTTYYKVAISASGNGCTTVTSAEAAIIVLSDITISTQPVLRTNICSGGTATLDVVASGGNGTFSYQWKSATVLAGPYTNISGATSSSYTTPALTQNTYYIVTVSNPTQGCDPVDSNVSAVIVPSISTQPVVPGTVCVGGTISLSTAASANGGSATFTYQWQSSADGTTGWTDVTTGTGESTANFISAGLPVTTYFRAVITSENPDCTLITNVVVANVIPDPTITTQPIGGNICEGGTFTMTSTAANGSGAFTYQWQESLNGLTGWADVTDGTGGNTTTYTTGIVTSDTFYRLHVTDAGVGCGVVNSNAAKVDVFESPLISTQPTDGEVCVNETHTFTVVASGNIPSGTLLYQWQTAPAISGPYANVSDGTGETTDTYTTPTYTTAGDRFFRVVISEAEAGCQTISNNVTLDVFAIPAAPIGLVTEQPSCDNEFGTVAISNPDLGTGYEYSKDGTTFQSSNIFENLPSGNVTIYVRRVGLNTCISSGTTFTIFNRICAVPETFASISGDLGGNTGTQTILDSDLFKGLPLVGLPGTPTNVTVTVDTIDPNLIFDPVTNTISVAAGTPPDNYQLTYTICEIGNPANCSTTTETISVTSNGIQAILDIVPNILNGYINNPQVINVLTNDKLFSAQATTSNVRITLVTGATSSDPLFPNVPVLNTTTGDVDVPAMTAEGTYTLVYQICESANLTNCDTARILIRVGTTVIDANDDLVPNVNGLEGKIDAFDALANDSLDGNPITDTNITDIIITQDSAAAPVNGNPNVPTFSTTTGMVSVPPKTPAGTYTITYHICEKLNPANCSDASIAIVVDAAPILANDDIINNVNGFEGASNVLNAYLNNDTYNGSPVNVLLVGQITPSLVSPAVPINGGPVPQLVVATGRVNVPAGTPAGLYQIKYQLCENLNTPNSNLPDNGNCNDATITIRVVAPPIIAEDDAVAGINGYAGANDVLNAYDNDSLNGGALDLTTITTTVISTPSPINGGPIPTFDTTTGLVSVLPKTPAGEYKFVYEICENLNAGNCDRATITITVVAAPIDAVNDVPFDAVDGFIGNPNVINALDNDTLDGVLVIPSEVEINVLIPAIPINGGLVPVLDPLTGNVNVPPGTAAGEYFITYRLREKQNPTNTDTALITIAVTAPVIEAVDDHVANINGYVLTLNALNVLTNDTLDGLPTNLSQVAVSLDTPATSINGGPVPILEPLTGIVTVLPGTPAGDYEIRYHICERLNSTNCSDAVAYINVVGPPIVAVDDTASGINGFTGATNVINALTNDTLNGLAVIPSQVTISNVVPATAINGGAIPILDPATGRVDVPPATAAGQYTIEYRLSENLNPDNFDTATITINVVAPIIVANDDVVSNINGFVGANNVINAITNDRLNGLDIPVLQINITSLSTATPVGYVAGNPIPVLNVLTGNVDVPAGTSAGAYTIHYRICEKLNPSNCDEADIVINVVATSIQANDDFASGINGFRGANNVVNILTNDVLNGAPVSFTQVDIRTVGIVTPLGVIFNGNTPVINRITGFVDVPPLTTSGTYQIRYEICEKLNPSNCSQATVFVVVDRPEILADDDLITGINGFRGAPDVLNALTSNDKYDGAILDNIDLVVRTVISPATPIDGGAVPVLLPATGYVTIPARTSAGTYQIKYIICDRLNPINCDEAIITVVVVSPPIVANDDAATGINGNTGANNVLNAYANDTYDGQPVDFLDFKGTVTVPATSINGAPVPRLNELTGFVDVPPGTHEGQYFIGYRICGRLNPTNCDDAIIRITVDKAPIDAVNDFATGIDGLVGNPNAVNALSNDTLNGVLVKPGDVVITDIILATPINGGAVPQLSAATGIVNVPKGTTAGTYVITYTIREATTLINADTATITIEVGVPSIGLVKTATFNDENKNGYAEVGETVTYNFAVTNTGSFPLTNITVTDPKPGITITGGPINLAPGQTDTSSFTGTYVLTAEDIDEGLVDNQAEVEGTSSDGLPVIDLSDDNSNFEDDPTILPLVACKVTIYNAVSPNGDGKNEVFKIDGIECYPNAYVEIYNRWGVLVYDAHGYNNDSVAFRGISEGRATIKQQDKLPDGTYFYVITYTTFLNQAVSKTGYLYLSGNN